MSTDNPSSPPGGPELPLSTGLDPIAELNAAGIIGAPASPGVRGTLNGYLLTDVVGGGAMGVVLLARSKDGTQSVAVKVLRPEFRDHARTVYRFRKEAGHMLGLDHPHILKVIEIGPPNLPPYFVMPFMAHGSLARHLTPDKPLNPEFTLRIASQVCSALQFAHSRGIIHQDLKPANILLDEQQNTFLTDFGLARRVDNDSIVDAQQPERVGTAPYMSPAAAVGQAEDTRGDIYSFGALLYELLTGRPPYTGQTAQEIFNQIAAGPPPPIHQLNREAPEGLASIAEGAMARTQRDRYASMADVLADLARVAEGRHPLGPHGQWKAPRGWYRALRHHPRRAALALVLVSGGVFTAALALNQPSLVQVAGWSQPNTPPWSAALLGDYDGDNLPELFISGRESVEVYSQKGLRLAEVPPPDKPQKDFNLELLADLDRDGFPEAWMRYVYEDQPKLVAVNKLGWSLAQFNARGTTHTNKYYGVTHTWLWNPTLEDLEADGRREVLATIGASWGLQPRGISCFDATNGTLRWQQLTAPFPTERIVADLNSDGRGEIFVGSHAASNKGYLPDGTSDTNCYVYAMSSDGNLLWRRQVGGEYCISRPLLSSSGSSNGAPGLFFWVYQGFLHHPVRTGMILKFDPAGNLQGRYDAGAVLLSCVPGRLGSSVGDLILASDDRGFLHVLDSNLRLLRRVELSRDKQAGLYPHIDAVTDLLPAAGNEIVLHVSRRGRFYAPNVGDNREQVNVIHWHDNHLLILDSQLKPRARFLVSPKWTEDPGWKVVMSDWDGDGEKEIVSLSDRVQVVKLRRRWF